MSGRVASSSGEGRVPDGGGAGKKICAGAGLRNVFVTLSAHLAAAGVRTWAAFAILRAWDGGSTNPRGKQAGPHTSSRVSQLTRWRPCS